MKPKELTFTFKPKPDITAYELAQILPGFLVHSRFGVFHRPENEGLRRHFETQELKPEPPNFLKRLFSRKGCGL